MNIILIVDGVETTIHAFDEIKVGISDFQNTLGTWLKVQQAFYRVEKEQFASEGAAGRSGKWQELKSPYKERKQKKYGVQPILQASRRLYKSMTQANSPDAIVEKGPLEMTLGSSLKYGGYHQRGGGRLPKRTVIDFTPEQEQQILAPIGRTLRQLAANARLRDARG